MPSDPAAHGERPAEVRSTAARPLVVEFLGIPGSGKTTLSTALVALLEERGLAAATIVGAARDHVRRTRTGQLVARVGPQRLRRFLLWQVFYVFGVAHAGRFGAEHRALARRILGTQVRRRIRIRTRCHIVYWFLQLCGRYRFLAVTSRPGEVLVVDDGFLQRSVHLHASPYEDSVAEQVVAYIELIPAPDVVVLLTARRETCEQRVRARGIWPHSRHLSAAELSRYFENAERVVDAAASRARQRGWRVIEIETDGNNPHRARVDLRRVLAPLVPGGKPKSSTGLRACP